MRLLSGLVVLTLCSFALGPLSNLPEFANPFSCKQGSEMVRPAEKRCEVW